MRPRNGIRRPARGVGGRILDGKPVGLVYLALDGPDGAKVEEFHFPGDRATITDAATVAALLMLLRGIEDHMAPSAS